VNDPSSSESSLAYWRILPITTEFFPFQEPLPRVSLFFQYGGFMWARTRPTRINWSVSHPKGDGVLGRENPTANGGVNRVELLTLE